MVLGDVGQPVAVVRPVADLQMVERIHMRAHLLGRGDLLDDPVDVVASPARRAGVGPAAVDVVVVGRQVLAERAAGEGGDVGVQDVCQVEDDAAAHQPDRLEHLRRGDLVQRAGLVIGSVLGWPPRVAADARFGARHSDDQVVSNDGNSVNPPSTKMVWPVM